MSDPQALKDIKKDIYLMIHKAGEMLELTEDGRGHGAGRRQRRDGDAWL